MDAVTGPDPSMASIEPFRRQPIPRIARSKQSIGRAVTASIAARQGPPWRTILAESPLQGNCHNYCRIDANAPVSHVRLNIFPGRRRRAPARLRRRAGGLDARARRGGAADLASIRNGGLVLGASDMHFGAKDNMIMPGRAANMGDGWETRRRRGPGHDWAIVRLGAPASSDARRDRHQSLQGQLPRQRVARGLPRAGTSAGGCSTGSMAGRFSRGRSCGAHHRHFSLASCRPPGRCRTCA